METKKTYLGVIGGSGLYDMPGLQNIQEWAIDTPFGKPSDKIVTGLLGGKPIAFLPRHGRGHRHLPSEVNYRANIYALKSLGVTHVLSVSAVGSLQEEYPPNSVVIPTQLLDRTIGTRQRTFFGNGVVGHIGFAEPFCPEMQKVALASSRKESMRTFLGGTLVTVEGPRFSSKAESNSFRALNATIIGMTAMPEAILAREAEMPYCTIAFVTDYDCWREGEEAVTVEAVMAIMAKNVDASKRIIRNFHEAMPAQSSNPIFNAAQYSIMTKTELIPYETRANLELLYGKYWNQ